MVANSGKTYMARALKLAEIGRGTTSPNPMVGAVIVKGGRVIAEGYHRKAGGDHAEIVALKKAGKKAAGATIYVTLEPCCHTGRTGPCSQALIKAGVAEVVFASSDPNPIVNGGGAKQLRDAGIRVKSGVLKAEAEKLNDAYYAYHRNGRPHVTLKLAQTLDGRIATTSGDSKWITSEKSRKLAHRIRSEVDAVLVGAGTVRADNPSLTVRAVKGTNPYRVVVTSSAKFPRQCNLFKNNDDHRTVIASSAETVERLAKRRNGTGLTYWTVKQNRNGSLNIKDLLKKASDFGLRSLLVEGGSELATAFIKAGLVDKYMIFVAPRILGKGINSVGDLGIRKMVASIDLDDVTTQNLDGDMLVTGYPRGKGN